MTIRVRMWGGLGDVLLATPALRALKAQHPDERLQVYGTRAHCDILKHSPHIDVLKPDSDAWLTRFLSGQVGAIRHFVANEKALRVMGSKNSAPARWLTRLLASEMVANYQRFTPSLTGRPAPALIGEALGVVVTDPKLEIWLTEEEQNTARAFMSRYEIPVVIHVTSQCSSNQNWPFENWETLVRRNPHVTFLQFGLPHEPLITGTVDMRGKTTVRSAIALLKYAKCFVGVVSSMAHATNAVNTPAVVLFGPSAPEVWSHANILPLSLNMRCAPCIDLLSRPCPYHAPCMSGIEVETVEAAMRSRLEARFPEAAPLAVMP